MSKTGGTICPRCHTPILPRTPHLCHIITTSNGVHGISRRYEVIDLVQSLDDATKRIAELDAELAALKADQLSWIMSQGQLAELEAAHERNANLVAELAVHKRALELAIEDILEYPRKLGLAGVGTAGRRKAIYLERARKELQLC